jgi:type I restriction enzyme, S subunit
MKEEKKLVPKLRFPEFRGAGAWEPSTLGEKSSILKGKGISKADIDPSGQQACIRYGELYTRYGETIREVISRTKVPPSELFLSKRDDVIIPSSGETKIDIAKASCVLAADVALGGDLNVIRSKLNGSFLSYYLNGPKKLEIAKVAQGDSVVHLYPHQLEALSIDLPKPAEQQKIAECLSSVDELMAAQARKVDALKTHKKGLMQQLFPREGETQPRLRFPEFQSAGEWMSDSLGAIFETASGGTPSRTEKAYWNGAIPWITTSLVDFQVITSAEEFITAEGLTNSSAKRFPKGTVLMAMYGQGKTRGQVALLGIEAATNQACAAILPRKDIDPYFVFTNLAGRYDEIRGLSNSGGQENLSQGLVREIPFAFPQDDAEQQKVTSCLSSLDALITAETQKLEALKTHKKGLMQQLFPSPDEVEA